MITLQPMNIVQAAADLLWSRVLRKFPTLKVALSEGGIGWIPYFLERVDYVYQHHHAWTGQDFGDQLPSQVFSEHIITCFIDDAVGLENRHHLDIDTSRWECDYPHSDSTWPHVARDACAEVARTACPTTRSTRSPTCNAMRDLPLRPVRPSPAEKCTVGALRQQAEGWDVSIKAQGIQGLGHERDGPPPDRHVQTRVISPRGLVAEAGTSRVRRVPSTPAARPRRPR